MLNLLTLGLKTVFSVESNPQASLLAFINVAQDAKLKLKY